MVHDDTRNLLFGHFDHVRGSSLRVVLEARDDHMREANKPEINIERKGARKREREAEFVCLWSNIANKTERKDERKRAREREGERSCFCLWSNIRLQFRKSDTATYW